eukprot:3158117-Prorocentrum_lima.AAC.1
MERRYLYFRWHCCGSLWSKVRVFHVRMLVVERNCWNLVTKLSGIGTRAIGRGGRSCGGTS